MRINETARDGRTTFMAECFWPGVTARKVADAGERLRRASLEIASAGGSARYLGSILVPTDEISLCLFEAASLDAAGELGRRAGIPSERILEIVSLAPTCGATTTTIHGSSKEHR
jgi:hypothetical protein